MIAVLRHRLEEGPRTLTDVTKSVGLGVAGLVTLGVGWVGAASQKRVDAQLGWGAVAVVGVLVLYMGGVLWLLVARRAIGVRMFRLLGEKPTPNLQTASSIDPSGALVAVEGLQRFHAPHCPMVRRRETVDASRADHLAAGRLPCGLCQP